LVELIPFSYLHRALGELLERVGVLALRVMRAPIAVHHRDAEKTQ
jgi:hypothetical protein